MRKALLFLVMFLLIPVSVRFDNAVAAEQANTAGQRDGFTASAEKPMTAVTTTIVERLVISPQD